MVSTYLKEILLNAGLSLKFVLVNVCDLDKCENRFSFPCKGPGNVNLALGEWVSSRPPPRLQVLILPLVNGAEYCCLPKDTSFFLTLTTSSYAPTPPPKDYQGRRNICISCLPPSPAFPLSPRLLRLPCTVLFLFLFCRQSISLVETFPLDYTFIIKTFS